MWRNEPARAGQPDAQMNARFAGRGGRADIDLNQIIKNRGQRMQRAEIRAKVLRLHDIWNTGNMSAIPEVYAESFVAHMPKGWEQSEFRGHSGVVDAILRIRNAFPDWRESVQDLLIDGSRAVTRYVSTGTHAGPFIGLAATGQRIEIGEISIYLFADGLIVEQWCLTDDLALAKQLGAIR